MSEWYADRFSRRESILEHSVRLSNNCTVLLRRELKAVQDARAEIGL